MQSLGLGDKTVWDLNLDGNNINIVRKQEELAQTLRNKLIFIRGEWRYEITVGIPYFEHILIDNPNLTIIESLFKKAILETNGVLKMLRFEMKLEKQMLSVSFSVQSIYGNIEGQI